jgi:hypothetical protein
MDSMSAEKFTNARIHEWLTPELDTVVRDMRTTRVQLNSAALWWFFRQLTPQERAHILGEYVKVQALGGRDAPADVSATHGAAAGAKGARRRKAAE